MPGPILQVLLDIPWVIFLIYWIIAAAKTRASQKQESSASRYGVMLILACGYFLLFGADARIGFLAQRFVPENLVVQSLGVILAWLGIALAIWARRHLAENWSARVTIKVDHELIRSGPYARLRHPIYTGLVLTTVGTAIVIGEWRGAFSVLLVLVAYSLKAKKEEEMLSAQFGDAYEEHRRRTGFLLPRFR